VRGTKRLHPIKFDIDEEGAQFTGNSSEDEKQDAEHLKGAKAVKGARKAKAAKGKKALKATGTTKPGETKTDGPFRAYIHANGCLWNFIDHYSANPKHPSE
jgi:hypothetical protein